MESQRGKKVVFVAYQDQENLGVGYLSSILISKGYQVETIDFGKQKNEICEQVKKTDPLIVGFSLIFQYHIFWLRELAQHLRKSGVDAHFTVGGHYPSLRFKQVLDTVPELNSVVRFEGELTICKLVNNLIKNRDWRNIKGIAYRKNGKVFSNEPRPLIDDLNLLPFPFRSENNRYQCMEKNYTFLIASRGCIRNCSFCSIRKFYQTAPGRLRRSRSPSNVVEEMKELHEKNDTSIFLFQDDNFLFPGRQGQKWISSFCDEVNNQGLSQEILFKISCRPDEVNSTLFSKLKKIGLFLTYLGIESGNQTGLKIMNKRITVEENIRAVKILNELKISYDFGFMLFDPSSTFETIRKNVRFLREICGDGSAPAVFCKMVPYAGTEIEASLIREKRLKGSIINPDYDFLDARLDNLYSFLYQIFHKWIFSNTGMLARLRWHRFEIEVLKKFYPYARGIPEYEEFLRTIISSSNELLFSIVEQTTLIFERNGVAKQKRLYELIGRLRTEHGKISLRLIKGMTEFQNQT
ncbi:MAG: B12-binding domain-containing radical SAM protein [Candidatus Hodarchaeota archaeon]